MACSREDVSKFSEPMTERSEAAASHLLIESEATGERQNTVQRTDDISPSREEHSGGPSWFEGVRRSISLKLSIPPKFRCHSVAVTPSESGSVVLWIASGAQIRREISEIPRRSMVTPAGFEPAISTLKGSRPGPG